MTIASEFDKITVKLGGTPSNGETVAAAIDALNDALAGSDQPCAQTVEQAVALLGEHISAGGGGGGGGAQKHTVTVKKTTDNEDSYEYETVSGACSKASYRKIIDADPDAGMPDIYAYAPSSDTVTEAEPGDLLCVEIDGFTIEGCCIADPAHEDDSDWLGVGVPYAAVMTLTTIPDDANNTQFVSFAMPDFDVIVYCYSMR